MKRDKIEIIDNGIGHFSCTCNGHPIGNIHHYRIDRGIEPLVEVTLVLHVPLSDFHSEIESPNDYQK